MLDGAFVHATALVESDQVGAGTRIWAFCHVMEGARIGAHCNIGDHCFIEAGAVIGDYVTIKNGNMIWEGVTLEDGVFVGPGLTFTNDLYPRSARYPEALRRYRDRRWLLPTLVRRGASLGGSAIILAGITLGEFAMVAAGAVVTRDVPAHALVVGNPARVTGWVCQCGQPLAFRNQNATCDDCGLLFRKYGDGVQIHGP